MNRKLPHFSQGFGVIACALLPALGCSGAEDKESVAAVQQPVKVTDIDIRRSLVVTEKTILSRFSLERVLAQLASQAEAPGFTALQLFQQWWDTQRPSPGAFPDGAHCNDTEDGQLGTVLNGYPYLCRTTAEGAQFDCDPFAAGSACAYIPIGLFNRFDQAPANGAHCGEYRIVYAKESGITTTSDRNLLIFEATLPNPIPVLGIKGCQQIVKNWADLTAENDIQKRADTLEDFYFEGQGLVPPVISLGNFGDNALGSGQIRTNQFSNTTTGWSLREFKLLRTCSGGVCEVPRFVPATVKNNAFGPLFSPTSTHPNASAFVSFFPSQVASLSSATLAGLDINVPDVFNSGQSQASGATAAEMRYLDQLTAAPSPLRTAVDAALAGSSLTTNDIVLRAQALTCAGCHRLNNNVAVGGGLVWPASLGFTHVTERETEVVGGEERFRISDTLVNVLLPAREAIIEAFIDDKPLPPRAPNHPLGASMSHG